MSKLFYQAGLKPLTGRDWTTSSQLTKAEKIRYEGGHVKQHLRSEALPYNSKDDKAPKISVGLDTMSTGGRFKVEAGFEGIRSAIFQL